MGGHLSQSRRALALLFASNLNSTVTMKHFVWSVLALVALSSCTKEQFVSPLNEETIDDACLCGTVRGIRGNSCSTLPEDNWITVQNECSTNVDTFFVSYETVLSNFPGNRYCSNTPW